LEDIFLGWRKNSIGFDRQGRIQIDGNSMFKFENAYEQSKDGDVIGIGIIHLPNSSMLCFVTRNGKLIGKII
jgi:hypothetical protein